MKKQVLFSLKDKSKILKCCLLQYLFDALRVNKGLFALYRGSWNTEKVLLKAGDPLSQVIT